MTSVLPFKKPPEREQETHLLGSAGCITCQHVWEAAAPLGTSVLECPKCGHETGHWRGPCTGPDDEVQFVCPCGCWAFQLTPTAVRCLGCGSLVRPYD